jgi:hypothetical protein
MFKKTNYQLLIDNQSRGQLRKVELLKFVKISHKDKKVNIKRGLL